ncbi:MAG: beta 1-4 rhamnosyltransferase Cps2T [Sarcina sp.]
MKNIFIIGSKGIPSNYGGFETFVEKLTEGKMSEEIRYHVSCLADNQEEFYHNDARCFNVKVPNIGAGKAIYYDVIALKKSIKYIKDNNLSDAVIYILACRIGPFIKKYKREAEKLGIKVYVNPDGHEWKRGKWNFAIKKYWKISEKLMVKHSDLLICDSKNIEKYIKEDYREFNPKTTFIAYGADLEKSKVEDDNKKIIEWYESKGVKAEEYYLIVGRFVPENNYEAMIVEFMKSKTKKDLVIITNVEQNKFYESLKEKTGFDKDKRIKFVGTVYNEDLLKKIRENAFAYLHGHEVGGTNPSLLEALATTRINILLNVGFNNEVGEVGAIYFEKNNLGEVIAEVEKMNSKEVEVIALKAKERINNFYTWEFIIAKYEKLFLG